MPPKNEQAHVANIPGAHRGATPGSIHVCDLELNCRLVRLDDDTPVGSQVSAVAGFAPDDQASVVKWRSKSLEDIGPNERVDLRDGGNVFIVVPSDGSSRFTFDGLRFDWPASRISVAALRKLAEVAPDKQIYLERQDEPDKLLNDGEVLDLKSSGVESLSSRRASWEIQVQGVRLTVHTPTVGVRDVLLMANINPDQGWQIFLKIAGQPKKPLGLEDVVDLTQPGIEKIRLTPNDVNNGEGNTIPVRAFSVLPVDSIYLDANHPGWQAISDAGRQWLLLPNYVLPEGFSCSTVSLALEIPPTYPAQQVDMFYLYPRVTLASGAVIAATEAEQQITGTPYQRWSRHRGPGTPWLMGVDNIMTHMALVESALCKEVEQ